MTVATPTVLIVEDDRYFARRLSGIVEGIDSNWVVHLEDSGLGALGFLEAAEVTLALALVDLGLPDMSGLTVIGRIAAANPSVPVMVLSVISSESAVLEAIRLGARGYLLKHDPVADIEGAIRGLQEGDYPISPSLARYLFQVIRAEGRATGQSILSGKETELLQYLARGLSYAEAATQMGIKLSTVRTHVENLYRKLGVHSQTQAVFNARERGLLK